MDKKILNNKFKFFTSIVSSWTILVLFISKSINRNNLIYAIGEIHSYDKSLFVGNVYMGEGAITPRFIMDAFFDLFMHLNGGDWASVACFFVYFGIIIEAIGIANISYRINKDYQIVISAIFTCSLAYCNNWLAGFRCIELSTIGMGTGIAFSILSLSFLVGNKRNYQLAWIFAACASICHIHEGLYCCAVIFIIALADSIIHRKILLKENVAIIIAILALAVIVIPSMATDSMDLTNEEFVYIYSIFRHPGHLVPSTWGIDSIYRTIWIDISLFIISLVATPAVVVEEQKRKWLEALLFTGAWIMAITLMYVFTEIKPIAVVSTMFFSKSFKYVLLIGVIWIIQASFELRKKGCILSHYLIIYYVFSVSLYDLELIGLLAVITVVFIKLEDYFLQNGKPIFTIPIDKAILADIVFFCFVICVRRESLGMDMGVVLDLVFDFKASIKSGLAEGFSQGLVIVLVFVAIFAIYMAGRIHFKGYKVFASFVLVCMIGLSLMGKVVIYDEGIKIMDGEIALKSSMGTDLYNLANSFKTSTNSSDEFLANPDDTENTGWFQVVSQRNCYVVVKAIPSTKGALDDWYNRYLQVNEFEDRTSDEIETVMRSSDIEYLLLAADDYERFDEDSDYEVYMSSDADSFRIYQLK